MAEPRLFQWEGLAYPGQKKFLSFRVYFQDMCPLNMRSSGFPHWASLRVPAGLGFYINFLSSREVFQAWKVRGLKILNRKSHKPTSFAVWGVLAAVLHTSLLQWWPLGKILSGLQRNICCNTASGHWTKSVGRLYVGAWADTNRRRTGVGTWFW